MAPALLQHGRAASCPLPGTRLGPLIPIPSPVLFFSEASQPGPAPNCYCTSYRAAYLPTVGHRMISTEKTHIAISFPSASTPPSTSNGVIFCSLTFSAAGWPWAVAVGAMVAGIVGMEGTVDSSGMVGERMMLLASLYRQLCYRLCESKGWGSKGQEAILCPSLSRMFPSSRVVSPLHMLPAPPLDSRPLASRPLASRPLASCPLASCPLASRPLTPPPPPPLSSSPLSPVPPPSPSPPRSHSPVLLRLPHSPP